jgi:SRSO17 transposase
MDAGYGYNTNLRTGISALALTYVAGILPNTTVWTPGTGPLPPRIWSGCGQRPKSTGPSVFPGSRGRDKDTYVKTNQILLKLGYSY